MIRLIMIVFIKIIFTYLLLCFWEYIFIIYAIDPINDGAIQEFCIVNPNPGGAASRGRRGGGLLFGSGILD